MPRKNEQTRILDGDAIWLERDGLAFLFERKHLRTLWEAQYNPGEAFLVLSERSKKMMIKYAIDIVRGGYTIVLRPSDIGWEAEKLGATWHDPFEEPWSSWSFEDPEFQRALLRQLAEAWQTKYAS